jgi:hypothetical protein
MGVLVDTGVLVGCAGTLVLVGSICCWVATGVLVGAGARVLVGAGARVLVGAGACVLVGGGTGVRVFVGGFGFDDEPLLVGVGVLVAAAKAVGCAAGAAGIGVLVAGCAAVAAGIGVLVAPGLPTEGVVRGVLTGERVAVVVLVMDVAALVDVITGGSVGGVLGASGNKSPSASTRSTNGWITDPAAAVAAGGSANSGVLSALMVGRGAAVSMAASIG